ncbi:hypothetical protein GLA29479_752 [Lysobacter antibioticus]|nr:hypothetical protein GLA29479_752 [Lysobacter antibioticus]
MAKCAINGRERWNATSRWGCAGMGWMGQGRGGVEPVAFDLPQQRGGRPLDGRTPTAALSPQRPPGGQRPSVAQPRRSPLC